MTCACRAAETVGVIEHGCSDAAHHLRAEDIPGERAAQPAGPGLRAHRALRRRSAAAAAARRAADPARARHRAGRARRDAAGGRTHLVLQRRRRAAAVPAADTDLGVDGLHVRADQPRVRRAADLLLAVHAGAAARAEVDGRAAEVGPVVRAHHADGRGAAVRGAAARAGRVAPTQAAGLPGLPRVFRRRAGRLRRRPEPSAVFGVPLAVHAAPLRVPLARVGAPHVPLGLRLVAVAPLPAGGRGGAGQGQVQCVAGRARRARHPGDRAARRAQAAAALETKTGKPSSYTRTNKQCRFINLITILASVPTSW